MPDALDYESPHTSPRRSGRLPLFALTLSIISFPLAALLARAPEWIPLPMHIDPAMRLKASWWTIVGVLLLAVMLGVVVVARSGKDPSPSRARRLGILAILIPIASVVVVFVIAMVWAADALHGG